MNPLPQVQRQLEARAVPVGVGAPAKQATRWMAPALPVFAGMPAPTGTAQLQMLMIVHTFVWLMAPSIENGRYHPPPTPHNLRPTRTGHY
ncbi:hypothetical protein BL240_10375 [Pseudomonas putida]|uniref:Uncharacterized protein n=1 Tax=Pseudomonas putida TaxID=303 RepID=A0A1L5PNT7_PSEPU|nr:hypothetical protein BL240_10375 [Pseudomonas putida]